MTQKIQSWDSCRICLSLLNGKPVPDTHDGMVAISKRCLHVFHKTCIESWLKKGNRNCPACRLNYIADREIVLNPEYIRQYQIWSAAPESYSYEKAFHDEYGHSSEQEGIPPEHILRPRELRGKERQEELTPEEIRNYWKERGNVTRKLAANSGTTLEEYNKAAQEVDEAQDLMLDLQGRQLAGISHVLDVDEAATARRKVVDAHRVLIEEYQKKVKFLDERICARLYRSKDIPLTDWPPGEKQKISELIIVSRVFDNFWEKFKLAGKIDDRSIGESKELLSQVDVDLTDFINRLPVDIKEIIENPVDTAHVRPLQSEPISLAAYSTLNQQASSSSSSSVPPSGPPPIPWQLIAAIGAIFSFVAVIAYQFRECLYRRFWNDRTITHQNEI